ncbi:patatin-like phospholipase family protein [Moraxella oblonga]|uniref:patatin-like phospholipase family protein n=1 Tax=Moraxella oblonga TaxID=200413 RepID=UPI000836F610|nr:patatin-like phospholipase family protein [Moraxella oblonga]
MKKFTTLVATSLSVLALTACTTKAPTPTPTVTPVTPKPKPAQIALVLGGGGAYGFAHVGVLEALHENNIRPDMVVGTSVGAIIGSLYASGKTPSQIRQIVVDLDETTLIDFTPSKQGFVAGEKLRTFINNHTQKPIEKFSTPFIAVATHKQSRQATPFYTGEAGLAVQASASIPNIFIAPRIPTNYGDKYIDGGQSALLPVRIAKSLGAKKVIAVNLLPQKSPSPTQTTKKQATIKKDDTGISATWGNQTVNIPVDFNALKNTPLPFGIDLSQILNDLPAQTQINLPDELPDTLPDKPQAFWKMLYTPSAHAHPEDLAMSDVIITPQLDEFAIFDTTQKTLMIQKGKEATLQKMNDIKKLSP